MTMCTLEMIAHGLLQQATAGLKDPTALNRSLYAWYFIHH